jgi:hypothetical protein
VAGFHYLEHRTADDVRALIADPSVRFDYLCWDLYARVSAYYDTPPRSAPSGGWRPFTPSKPEKARRPSWAK